MKPRNGFFFGSTNYSEKEWAECQKDDLAFIATAREHIAEGYTVTYDSWW